MRLRFNIRWLWRWAYGWNGWYRKRVALPIAPVEPSYPTPTRLRAITSLPDAARRTKGPSACQRHASKRRMHVQALRSAL